MVKYLTGSFDVWLADENEMKKLGKKWMKDGEFHEVISFPLEEKGPGPDRVWRLGDVVVWEGAKDRDGLVEHGVWHLLGEHHS